ncbi:MAG: Vitamin B12 import ATP-binding protein BtuD [bacterium]|nr:Vitamin B12 import ATP-binding protein BtuD [bacterium]
MSDIAIRVEGLSKQYRIGARQERYKALRDSITDAMIAPFRRAASLLRGQASDAAELNETIWALQDVSFEVKQGEVIGVIGRNGAGKSTLLKILSRITEPTKGYAEIYGRVGSLLEVGTGFHPELTGRENIFLNGAILGMRRREIERKFDEIVAFAEIEKFIDTPVKHYSSGMYVRLAFAVAAHLEPDVLIVDEVLAVGDGAFQKKCLGKMSDVAKAGRTVLFVSHNLATVNQLTERCLYLVNGQVMAFSSTRVAVNQYLKETLKHGRRQYSNLDYYRQNPSLFIGSPAKITHIRVSNDQVEYPTLEIGSSLELLIDLEVSREIAGAMINLILKNAQGEHIVVFCSHDYGFSLSLQAGKYQSQIYADDFPLAPGEYYCNLGIASSTQSEAYDTIVDFPLFQVVNNGQVISWLNRPWGAIHWDKVEWNVNSLIDNSKEVLEECHSDNTRFGKK